MGTATHLASSSQKVASSEIQGFEGSGVVRKGSYSRYCSVYPSKLENTHLKFRLIQTAVLSNRSTFKKHVKNPLKPFPFMTTWNNSPLFTFVMHGYSVFSPHICMWLIMRFPLLFCALVSCLFCVVLLSMCGDSVHYSCQSVCDVLWSCTACYLLSGVTPVVCVVLNTLATTKCLFWATNKFDFDFGEKWTVMCVTV